MKKKRVPGFWSFEILLRNKSTTATIKSLYPSIIMINVVMQKFWVANLYFKEVKWGMNPQSKQLNEQVPYYIDHNNGYMRFDSRFS